MVPPLPAFRASTVSRLPSVAAAVQKARVPASGQPSAPVAAPAPSQPSAAVALSLTGRRWRWPNTAVPASPDAGPTALAPAPGWLTHLLVGRGVKDDVARQAFLQPALKQLADPSGIAGMAAACERLIEALARGERACVYGDYDVDGVCASAVLAEFFQAAGLAHEVYIPDRRTEGYGLNLDAIAEVAKRCQLLVTVDCGSTSIDEIARAKTLGLEIIVVDHHQVGSALPEALAVLNPHRPDCAFADKDLCATGVAFMLVVALRRALRTQPEAGAASAAAARFDVRALLDLVAVATVADMVALRGINRILVSAGLRRLREAARPGMAALMRVAGIVPAQVTAADLGFRIGPRINACGRLAHAGLAVDLMRAHDVAHADSLARELNDANGQRRQIEAETVAAAVEAVQRDGLAGGGALVVADASWHPGVLGLVASRLVQRYHRPAVVVGEGGKGSARSVDGLDLHACLQQCRSHLLRFGGHPAAAGLTMAPQHVEALRQSLCREVEARLGPGPYVAPLTPDLEVPFSCMHLGTVNTLKQLEPFGRENPEVLFVARGLYVQASRRVGATHLKLRLAPKECPSAGSIDAIAFGMGDHAERLPACVDAAFHLEENSFRGMVNVQMRVVDLRKA